MADQDETKKANSPYTGRRRIEDPDAFINDIPIICERIRFYREKKGIEQKAIAEALGIKSNAISNWESGRTRPDLTLLPKISKLLDVSIDELFGLSAPEAPEPKPAITVTSRKPSVTDRAMEKYTRLNRVHRSVVDSLMDKLSEVEDEELYNSITVTTRCRDQLSAGFCPGMELAGQGDPLHVYADKVDSRMDCVFPVSGDSMEPEFHDGDLVMVQQLRECSELEVGEIGAFTCGNDAYIKVYSKGGLRSLNKKYKMIRFSEDDQVMVIGRVLGVLDPAAIVSYEDMQRYEIAQKRIEERDAEESEDE